MYYCIKGFEHYTILLNDVSKVSILLLSSARLQKKTEVWIHLLLVNSIADKAGSHVVIDTLDFTTMVSLGIWGSLHPF